MSRLRFAESFTDAVRGMDHLVVLGTASRLRRAPWKKLTRASWGDLLPKLAEDAEPGTLGGRATTYTGTSRPRRVTVAALPDVVSRHVSPSRNHAIHECCSKAAIAKAGKTGVVLLLEDAADYMAAANAVGRALPLYRRKTNRKGEADVTVAALGPKDAFVKARLEVREVAEAARWAASLVDRPTAELTTADFAAEAVRFAKRGLKGIRVKTLVGDDLLKHSLGGVHAVGRTAMVAPRMLVMEHGPKNAKLTVALVGKGVVYDTGGLSLKPPRGMTGMKGDMGGAAAVAGAFRVLAATKFPHRVICVVPLAENAIGPDAYRPDDIITMHSGKTVEITNTDAEGRLLLGDGVSYAARVLGADVVIDAATLTGAQLVATGRRHAAIATDHEGLERITPEVGRRSGDLCHPLVYAPEFHRREFKSDIADMLNSVRDRMNAQSSCAAWFVQSHLEGTKVAWMHVDLAGPAHPSGKGSGFGVALLSEVVRDLKSAGIRA